MSDYTTCSKCGVVKRGHKCPFRKSRQKSGDRESDKFRNTLRWQRKREEIKIRDRHLCQLCLRNLYNTLDMVNFKNIDVVLPMIYHKFYGWEDEMVATATREGVEGLAAAGSSAYLCSGLFVGHMPEGKIYEFMDMTRKAGSKGFCFFSMEGLDRKRGGGDRWGEVAEAIKKYKEGETVTE